MCHFEYGIQKHAVNRCLCVSSVLPGPWWLYTCTLVRTTLSPVQDTWNAARVRVSTRAMPADTCRNGEAVRASIGTVSPDVRTRARLVFYLLCIPLYLSLAKRAIHCYVSLVHRNTDCSARSFIRWILDNGHLMPYAVVYKYRLACSRSKMRACACACCECECLQSWGVD